MNSSCIAISFDNNPNLIPIIKINNLDGRDEIKKVIKEISNIDTFHIFYIDFQKQEKTKIKSIIWPPIPKGDLLINHKMHEGVGNIKIRNTAYSWDYNLYYEPISDIPSMNYIEEIDNDDNCHGNCPDSVLDSVVDKNKVREIEREKEKSKYFGADTLASELNQYIYGQEEAISRISELVVSNLRRKNRELLIITLFGQTGLGKTEIGKCLPKALTKLTGNHYEFQQVALNEFSESSMTRFFGAPPSYVGYSEPTIFEPALENKYQVFILDEIEKMATDKIWVSLMQVFDEGFIRLSNNKIIDLRDSIIIITSNEPVDMEKYNNASIFGKKEVCRDALLKKYGHPEIWGRIPNCIAFQNLSSDAQTNIICKFIIEELNNFQMTLNKIDEELLVQLKKEKLNYGARGVKTAVREAFIPITAYGNIEKFTNKKVNLKGDLENIKIEIVS